MKLECHLCKNKWNYKGLADKYATCPKCLRKTPIKSAERGEGKWKN